MFVQKQAAVEVRTGLDRALAAVGRLAAVEDRPAVIVDGLELDPDVEGIDRTARKEVADLPRAHDDLDPHGLAAAYRLASTLSSGAMTSAAGAMKFCAAPKLHRLFADGKGAGRARLVEACVGPRPWSPHSVDRTMPKMSTVT